jgi:uncharacterized protein DUF6968
MRDSLGGAAQRRRMTDPIAAAEFDALLPSGERRRITLKIGRPYRASTGEWRCPMALDGLQERLPDAAGEDSLQSLCLALRLLMSQLEGFVGRGGQLFFADGTDHLPLDAYLQSGIPLGRPA